MSDDVRRELAAQAEGHLVMDVAKHVAEQVHEIVKRHACAMPTVSAAIGVGLVVMQQIYGETIQFAVNSMEGDEDDIDDIRRAARKLARELLDVLDREPE